MISVEEAYELLKEKFTSPEDSTVQIWTNELKNEYIKKYTDIKQRRLGD